MENVFLITNKERTKFLCRNSTGRYFDIPKKRKDIITYPNEGSAKMIVGHHRGDYNLDSNDKSEMMVVQYELILKEVVEK
ncbi:hypothetical protein LIV57_06740 [Chryseobacterium sp. X308]|uniref:hypothetical protein n=1 Tax=Chryseobacterium sp. X308 TaxID=2884873 RepID=UPI001D13EBA9|nr:hypothetical protein [Chryseobacterium sp. X308]MCC3214964.1 hypothetical protein [Chryseobacterium sp. X308]